MESETIFALSSASGRSGVAVVRVSGPNVRDILLRFCGDVLPARKACLRAVRANDSAEILDTALVLFFPAPHSFTGQDIVEFQVHGSIAVVKRLLAELSQCPGCRAAHPGEFTRRAFFNGQLDLIEVEALSDLLSSETESQRILAINGSSRLSKVVSDWRARLIHLRGICEAYIDFSDESDVAGGVDSVSERHIETLSSEIMCVLKSLPHGKRVRNGFRVAVLGPPNAGKSTLVNALADRDVSIISPLPGTTRDVVEVHLDLDGFAVIISDTAGIRVSGIDLIEEEGIRRAWSAADAADLVLWVTPIDSDVECPSPDFLVVRSKDDRGVSQSGQDYISISAASGFGMDVLLQAIRNRCEVLSGDSAFAALIAHERQASCLSRASEHLSRALAFSDVTLDIRAEELRLACHALDLLIGKVSDDDVLDIVFSQFCIGK